MNSPTITNIKLRDYQIEGLKFLESHAKAGFATAFTAPTGVGRTLILANHVRDGKVTYVSDHRIMRDQFQRMCEGLNVEATFMSVRHARSHGFTEGEKVIICESARFKRDELAAHISECGALVVL